MQWTCGLTTWSTWAGGFFFSSSGDHRHLHSFPTRRSSDLADILHCLQLNNRGRPTRSVNAVDVRDRKSTRLNSSHVRISYAVFCLKKNRKRGSAHPPQRSSAPHEPSTSPPSGQQQSPPPGP